MTVDEARRAARREFGGVEQTREAYRELSGLPLLDTLRQDLRFALRGLTQRPGFADCDDIDPGAGNRSHYSRF